MFCQSIHRLQRRSSASFQPDRCCSLRSSRLLTPSEEPAWIHPRLIWSQQSWQTTVPSEQHHLSLQSAESFYILLEPVRSKLPVVTTVWLSDSVSPRHE
jgi:hypothetical protein